MSDELKNDTKLNYLLSRWLDPLDGFDSGCFLSPLSQLAIVPREKGTA